ncbi:hypothetical protein SAMN05519103_06317 [Rhizobiales bacterium GAS113]|nr:hypothetical protein SAMN05519103_06317 [Rhizobiales bacterium GAS113]
MEHQPLNELCSIAGVQLASMTWRQRLERWVELLDREPLCLLTSLGEKRTRARSTVTSARSARDIAERAA